MIAGMRSARTWATSLIGLAGFPLFAGVGALALTNDRLPAAAGHVAQKAWNWLTRGRHRVIGPAHRLLGESSGRPDSA